MTRLAEASRGAMTRFLLACVVVYLAAAWATDAPQLILVLNGIALGMSAGVCFAYAPVLGDALIARVPDRGHHLGAGIFFVSLAVFLFRALSFVARDLGYPEIYNTDAMTAALAVAIVGAWFHLRAPEAGSPRVPQRGWVTGGAAVAAGVFLAVVIAVAHHHVGTSPPVQLR